MGRAYTRAMSLRKISRIVVHVTVVLAMVLASAAAPALAATSALESLPPAVPAPMTDMPCDDMAGMSMPSEAPAPAGDPCVTHHCDLSACLGIACLAELPEVLGVVSLDTQYAPTGNTVIPPGVADTPLRPPNA